MTRVDKHQEDDLIMTAEGFLPRVALALVIGIGTSGVGVGYWALQHFGPNNTCRAEFLAQALAEGVDPARATSYHVTPHDIGSDQAECEAFIYGNPDVRFIEWNTETGYRHVDRKPTP